MQSPKEKFLKSVAAGFEEFLAANTEPGKIASSAETNEFEAVSEFEEAELESESPLSDPSVTQAITRYSDEQGVDHFVGYYRVCFIRNETTQIIHVNFWPSFRQVPRLTATILSGSEAKSRVTLNEVFGARVEISVQRKSRINPEAESLIVEIVASSDSNKDPQLLAADSDDRLISKSTYGQINQESL